MAGVLGKHTVIEELALQSFKRALDSRSSTADWGSRGGCHGRGMSRERRAAGAELAHCKHCIVLFQVSQYSCMISSMREWSAYAKVTLILVLFKCLHHVFEQLFRVDERL